MEVWRFFFFFFIHYCRSCFSAQGGAVSPFSLAVSIGWFGVVNLSDSLGYGTANAVSICGHCLSSIFSSSPLAWLVCLTLVFCLLGVSEGLTLFLWVCGTEVLAVGLEFGLEDSDSGGVEGAVMLRCGGDDAWPVELLLAWESSDMGGSASSWIVGTEASKLRPL